jgi:hypothetical protein
MNEIDGQGELVDPPRACACPGCTAVLPATVPNDACEWCETHCALMCVELHRRRDAGELSRAPTRKTGPAHAPGPARPGREIKDAGKGVRNMLDGLSNLMDSILRNEPRRR